LAFVRGTTANRRLARRGGAGLRGGGGDLGKESAGLRPRTKCAKKGRKEISNDSWIKANVSSGRAIQADMRFLHYKKHTYGEHVALALGINKSLLSPSVSIYLYLRLSLLRARMRRIRSAGKNFDWAGKRRPRPQRRVYLPRASRSLSLFSPFFLFSPPFLSSARRRHFGHREPRSDAISAGC
jgi:hypothetical protein